MGVNDALQLAKFLASHAYSNAPEATRKEAIDGQILSRDFSKADAITIHNEGYLKELIRTRFQRQANGKQLREGNSVLHHQGWRGRVPRSDLHRDRC